MRFSRHIALIVLVTAASFLAAYSVQRSRTPPASRVARKSLPANAPDSVRLNWMGIRPGRQLVVYVLVGSHCGYCEMADTKEAIRAIKLLVRASSSGAFQSTTVVAVGVDSDLSEGLQYVSTIGLQHFDEISIGNAWLNDQLVRLVWRDSVATAAVPQVVLISRQMTAKPLPLVVHFGSDSVLRVVTGHKALLKWVHDGSQIFDAQTQKAPIPSGDHSVAGL